MGAISLRLLSRIAVARCKRALRTKWRFWTSWRHFGCTLWRSQLLCLTQLLFIKDIDSILGVWNWICINYFIHMMFTSGFDPTQYKRWSEDFRSFLRDAQNPGDKYLHHYQRWCIYWIHRVLMWHHSGISDLMWLDFDKVDFMKHSPFPRSFVTWPNLPDYDRVATAQGKQDIWKSIFTDREDTGNFAKNIKNMFLHRKFTTNIGKGLRVKKIMNL